MMKKQSFVKKVVLGLASVVVTVAVVFAAVDMPVASGLVSDVSVMAVQAKASLAKAASSGDIQAITTATKISELIDNALAEAEAAYAAIEKAVAAGDQKAAAKAAEKLAKSVEVAKAAKTGELPKATKKPDDNQSVGAGAYDVPNIYEVPWQSAGLRSIYSALFNEVLVASGGSMEFIEGDATPH
jgi:hypothetical protein